MVSLRELADDSVLRGFTDAATLARGAAYARDDRVHKLDVAHNIAGIVVQATVLGSGASIYQTVISARRDDRGSMEVYAACSCPIARSCKHAVAALIVARERADEHGRIDPGPTRSQWEQTLADLLDAVDEDIARTPRKPPTALALQFDVPRVTPPVARYARWSGSRAPKHPKVRIRPVSMGARGRWVKSSITWADLPYADQSFRESFSKAHLDVLRELLVAQRAGSRHAYGYDNNAERDLHTFGPSLWRLLRQCRDLGLPLVGSGPISEVRVASSTASLRLDVARTEDKAVHLRAGADLDGVWTDAKDVVFIGEPAHGVVLWSVLEAAENAGPRMALTLAPLDKTPAPALHDLIVDPEDLDVPPDDVELLLDDYVPRVQRLLPVGSRDGSVELPDPVAPRLVLTVTWSADDEVRLTWTFSYAAPSGTRHYGLDDRRSGTSMRDHYAENEILADLGLDDEQSALLCGAGALVLRPELTLRGMETVHLGQQILPGLRANHRFDVVDIGDEPQFREAVDAPVIAFGAPVDDSPDDDTRTDWLELEVIVTVEGSQIALATLLEALTTGQTRILLHKGVFVDVDRPEFAALARVLAEARALQEQPRDGVRVARGQLDLWTELAEIGIVDEQAREWTRTAEALGGIETLPEVAVPASLRARLRPYQHDGFRWLSFLHDTGLGGILADDMGLGKTLQTLAMIVHAREGTPGQPPMLVVAPTSVVGTWAAEARTFAPGLVVRTVTEGRTRRPRTLAEIAAGADVVVSSYTLFRLEFDGYDALDWSGLVLDEAQAIKNHKGKTYQCVRRLDTAFKLAITGTPMENNLMELWSLLSVTAPGLFPHPGRFAEHFANPIERGHDRDRLATLRRRIRPLMLRRTKELVASDLPPKQEQVLQVSLTPRHRTIYDTHLQRERQKILGLIDDLDENRITIFSALTRLRQLSLHAGLVDSTYDAVESAKIDLLVEHLAELAAEGHRALVFSQFTGFLGRVRARLDAERMPYSYLDGSTRRRAEVIAGFKSGADPVFLISLKAGGVGLTLTEADYVFILDPWWNPAVEAQAVDRTHRIGQANHVMVYRLVSADTIEEKVMELKVRKQALFSSVLEGDEVASASMSADDIRAMLS